MTTAMELAHEIRSLEGAYISTRDHYNRTLNQAGFTIGTLGSKFEDKRTPLGTKLVAVIYTEGCPKHKLSSLVYVGGFLFNCQHRTKKDCQKMGKVPFDVYASQRMWDFVEFRLPETGIDDEEIVGVLEDRSMMCMPYESQTIANLVGTRNFKGMKHQLDRLAREKRIQRKPLKVMTGGRPIITRERSPDGIWTEFDHTKYHTIHLYAPKGMKYNVR